MRPSVAFYAHRQEVKRIVELHHAKNARIFGSVLHGNDVDGSDLDLLVDPTAKTTLLDIGAIRHELHQLLSVPVDVLTPKALPSYLKDKILSEAVLV